MSTPDPLIYAGIDEAGYGPMLGPLCVGVSAFIVDGCDPAAGAPDLWRRLDRAVCRRRRDRRGRIAVEDSKKLTGARSAATHPLTCLERGVLAFGSTLDLHPADDDALFTALLPSVPDAPWYRSSTALPVAAAADRLGIDAARLRRALAGAGVRCAGLRAEVIDAGPFNEQVRHTGSKAAVNFAAVLRLVDDLWRRWPEAHPRIIVDRQGGRTRYREDLQLGFPDAMIRIVAETDACSRYRLDRDGSRLTVSFVREAERQHLPVALASMLAKYVRELFMLRLNRFFRGHLPRVRPTAGYVQDARRYLREIEPVVTRLGIDRPRLVRAV